MLNRSLVYHAMQINLKSEDNQIQFPTTCFQSCRVGKVDPWAKVFLQLKRSRDELKKLSRSTGQDYGINFGNWGAVNIAVTQPQEAE